MPLLLSVPQPQLPEAWIGKARGDWCSHHSWATRTHHKRHMWFGYLLSASVSPPARSDPEYCDFRVTDLKFYKKTNSVFVQVVKLQVMLTIGGEFSQLRHLYYTVKISASSQKQRLRNSASSTGTIQYPKFLAAGRSFKIRD